MKNPYKFCPYCGEKLGSKIEHNKKRIACLGCGFIYYSNAKPTVAAIILNKKGEVLLAKRSKEPGKGLWNLPGGFLEENELPEEGLKREIKEETNLDIKSFKLLGIYLGEYENKVEGRITTFNAVYLVEKNEGEMRPDDDASELKYFSLNSHPPMAFVFEEKILRELSTK